MGIVFSISNFFINKMSQGREGKCVCEKSTDWRKFGFSVQPKSLFWFRSNTEYSFGFNTNTEIGIWFLIPKPGFSRTIHQGAVFYHKIYVDCLSKIFFLRIPWKKRLLTIFNSFPEHLRFWMVLKKKSFEMTRPFSWHWPE